MAIRTNVRFLRNFFVLFLYLSFVGLFYGCGDGPGVPAGTVISPAGVKILLTGSPASLSSGQNSIITATVTDGSGKSVVGATVNFSFNSNNSGATCVTLNGGKTDANGQAIAVYTAGANTPASSVQDTIQGAATGAVGVIIITRTASIAPGGLTVSIAGSVTSLAAGQSSIITATVINSSGNPASSETVNFSVLTNNSGATLSDAIVTTDASGKATTIYTAGANTPTTTIQDTIRGTVTGAKGEVIITRTGTSSTPVVPVGYHMALNAEVTSLAAGQSSIITATVTNGLGNPVSGQTVTFSRQSDVSGGTLSTLSGITDATGKAVAVYKAGALLPTTTVQDVIQVRIPTGEAAAIIITRTGSAVVPTGYRIVLTADATSLAAGKSTIITATVTNGSGNPATGQTVTFAPKSVTSGATLSNVNATTDASGRATAIYTAGALLPTDTVQDSIQASIPTGEAAAIIITRTGSAVVPTGYRIVLTADATSLAAGKSTIITATVTNGSGNPATGQTVTFAPKSVTSGATLSNVNATTDASGRATAIYTAGALLPTDTVQDSIQASIPTGEVAAIIIARTGSAVVPTGYNMKVEATPTSVVAGALSVIVAKIQNADGTAASGLAVTFGFVTNNSGAPVLNVLNGTTDATGTAIATYTAGSNSPGLSVQDAVFARVNGSTSAAIITRLPASGTGNRISLSLTPSVLPTTTSNCIVTAQVLRDDNLTPVANETVTFSIITGGGAFVTPLSVTTNNSGIANAVFAAPGGATGFEAVVRVQILGTTNGGDAVGIIYW